MGMIRVFLFLISLVGIQAVHAKRFQNEYTEFELPPAWECALEGSEWVCQSENEARKKEAIIILVAKIKGPQDTLDEYLNYLKNTKTYDLPGGKKQVSEPKYAKNVIINEQPWIDSLHLASEVPGFYTRYLATIKEDLGVAVTFSVSKEFYTSYQAVFDKVVETLRVFRKKNVDMANYKVKARSEDIFDSAAVPGANPGAAVASKNKSGGKLGGGSDNTLLLLVLVAAGAGIFIYIRKKKK